MSNIIISAVLTALYCLSTKIYIAYRLLRDLKFIVFGGGAIYKAICGALLPQIK